MSNGNNTTFLDGRDMSDNECSISFSKLEKKVENSRNDHGFMGRTHALSAAAAFLFMIILIPNFSVTVLQSTNTWVIVFAGILTIGASLFPDLDNSSSTARNSLGPIGVGLSYMLRWISVIVQTVIRTKRDDKDPNPHRGFAHTILFAILAGVGTFFLVQIPTKINLEKFGITTVGDLIAIIIATILLYLAMISLVKPMVKALRNGSDIVVFLISLVITTGVFTQIELSHSYWWIGAAITIGCIIHDIGDCFTTAGCPILFPLPIKKKFWWMIRFTKIKAGGDEEKKLFVPLFIVLIVAGVVILLLQRFGYIQ